jgi:membrane fusion protein, multidrug efflux system
MSESQEPSATPPLAQNRPTMGAHKSRVFILFAIILLGAVSILLYLRYQATHLSTDDAYVDGRIHVVAPRVSGPVVNLCVQDNQLVKTGDLLLEIDPNDYMARLASAQADVETETAKLELARKQVETAKMQKAQAAAGLESARALVAQNQASLDQTVLDLNRAEELFKGGSFTREQEERAATSHAVAAAALSASRGQVTQLEATVAAQEALIQQAEAAVPAQEAVLHQKQAALLTAKLNVSYARITAPADGQITRRSVEVGNQVQPGQALMSIVPLDTADIWITANYKETQLNHMQPGQKVRIRVDAYPGLRLEGRVETLMAGTGSAFSLFPAENATGNFVKVVQRVPVRIMIESGADPNHPLRIGMSVVPTVLTQP